MSSIPAPGTTVTYLNADPSCADILLSGVASGPAVHDPRTSQDWIPVVCPRRGRMLVHENLIVECAATGSPRVARFPKTPEAIRDAVLRWSRHVAMLAGTPCTPWDDVADLLEQLLTALSPMRGTLRALERVDPSGGLAEIVLCLTEATWHLNEGDIRATRDAIATGANALARYLTAD